ncbi:hypothetical protein [Natrialba asiatica]|uniref:DUF5658 domain-containing protein n=1 Tax=Natrialba asiatica (strain ATCC 700177 / DSM 12278 / JCM 9576 / FERM P-10747 / NBRC 102637 / 172P1) TaxID=29540 RepID=M0AXP9_NATA1|nr:hypothetical protein [Natrialba asiatica]ELZ03461.1 hypothetical protein C481_05690 [Natrialba asiatica DSM 12278]
MTDHAVLWLLAVCSYGLGDLITTAAGLRYAELEEGSAFVRRLLGEPPTPGGLVRFGAFKGVLFLAFYGGYLFLAGYRMRVLVPAAIAGIGIVAVSNNLRAIRRVR